MHPGLEPAQATRQFEEQPMSMLDVAMAAGCVLLVALIILRKKVP